MNILRHLDFHSVICRSPDEPAAPEPVVEQGVEPVMEPAAEPIVEPVVEPVAEPAPSAAAALAPAPAAERMVSARIFEKTAFELREDKRQANARAEAAEKRAAEYQAIVERLQSQNPDPNAPPVARPAAPAAPPAQDFDTAVQAAAAKQRLYDDTLVVRSTGQGAFADFNQSLGILTAIGATNDDFVSDILAVDKAGAHIIIDKLAKDPEKAASLVTMDSRRRIAELTRMADAPKPTAAAAAPVADPAKAPAISRAPAPAPRVAAVQPAADIDPTTPEGNEKMSDAQFEKWYKAKYYKRA